MNDFKSSPVHDETEREAIAVDSATTSDVTRAHSKRRASPLRHAGNIMTLYIRTWICGIRVSEDAAAERELICQAILLLDGPQHASRWYDEHDMYDMYCAR